MKSAFFVAAFLFHHKDWNGWAWLIYFYIRVPSSHLFAGFCFSRILTLRTSKRSPTCTVASHTLLLNYARCRSCAVTLTYLRADMRNITTSITTYTHNLWCPPNIKIRCLTSGLMTGAIVSRYKITQLIFYPCWQIYKICCCFTNISFLNFR